MRKNIRLLQPVRLAAVVGLSAMMMVGFYSGSKAFGGVNEDALTKSRFFQYLSDPNPAVRLAIFRKEINAPEIPKAARTQLFALRKAGDDYIISVLAGTNESTAQISAGAHKGRSWGIIKGELTVSDPAINKQGTPIAAQESVTRMTAALLVNFGISELVRGSLEWNGANSNFIGKSISGGDLIISFELINQLPKRAIILNASGGHIAYVDYEYSNGICNGELPFRFSRHFGSPEQNIGLAYKVELIEAEFGGNQAGIVLDPVSVFNPRNTGYYSNSVLYTIGDPTTGDSRKPTRALTMAEYQASMAAVEGPKKSVARVFVFTAVALGLIAPIVFLIRTNKQTNKQK